MRVRRRRSLLIAAGGALLLLLAGSGGPAAFRAHVERQTGRSDIGGVSCLYCHLPVSPPPVRRAGDASPYVSPVDLAITPDGRHLFVSAADGNEVLRVDLGSLKVTSGWGPAPWASPCLPAAAGWPWPARSPTRWCCWIPAAWRSPGACLPPPAPQGCSSWRPGAWP